ncbi:MAG: hypothetical protein EA401_07090 [Planctomycetota bacterium]|nr:MAG: hypothetical protein EA401_07090 [Planctomycetota bacterium]
MNARGPSIYARASASQWQLPGHGFRLASRCWSAEEGKGVVFRLWACEQGGSKLVPGTADLLIGLQKRPE